MSVQMPEIEVPPLECPAVLLPTPANLSNFFSNIATNMEKMIESEIDEIKEEGEKLKATLKTVRDLLSPYDPKFQRLEIPEKEWEIMIQRLLEEYPMYVPAKILEIIDTVFSIEFNFTIPGINLQVDLLKLATDRSYLSTKLAEIDVDSMYDLLPSEYKIFGGEFGLENKELKAKQIQDYIKNEATKKLNLLMTGGFTGLIDLFDEIWDALGLPSLPTLPPTGFPDVKALLDSALDEAKTDLEKLEALKEIKIAGFDVEALLGGEFNDNVESLEFKIARINAKLKEFEQNWQQFLLKEWMNKVTSFFDAIGLGALTAWITFDFCDFMKIIGIPTTIDLSSFSGIKQIAAQTSTLSQKAINPPAEGA